MCKYCDNIPVCYNTSLLKKKFKKAAEFVYCRYFISEMENGYVIKGSLNEGQVLSARKGSF